MLLWSIYISLISANLIAAIIRWQHLSKSMKAMFTLVLTGLIVEIFRGSLPAKGSYVLSHSYFVVELLLQFFYYYILLEKGKRVFLYTGITFFFTGLFVLWNVNPQYMLERNYIDGVFLGVCVSLWSGLFFHELIRKPLKYSLKSDGNFWVNCGNILFYPGTLLLFGLGSYIEGTNPDLRKSLSPLNYALNLILYLLSFIAFCYTRKQALKKPDQYAYQPS
jgi:hypothetical protein